MSVLRDKAILKWLNSQRDEAILEWLQGQLQVVNGIEDISTLIADASSRLDELSHSVFENWDVRTSESSLEATEKKLRVSLSTFQHDALATQFEKVANLIRKVSPPGFPRPTNTKIKKEK